MGIAVLLLSARAVAQPADWGPKRDPFDPAVVARYKQILARDPHDATALAKLQQLYRSFRTIDQLEAEYAQVPDDRPTLVVRARLRLAHNDAGGALALYTRAAELDPDDPRVWMAVGELRRRANQLVEARAAYDHALAETPPPPIAEQAQRALVDLAIATHDAAAIDAGTTRLIAMRPGDVERWIARGDALANAGRYEPALEAFTAAEGMLGGNPQRRLDVIAHRGNVLEKLHDERGAIAEYRRAIALAPPGYYLVAELTDRIIDAYRREHALPELVERLEHDWPERSRGHREWNTLGSLYAELGDRPHAIAALQHATKLAPFEIDTQRHLIALLDQAGRHDAALEQYAAAIRAAPGDSTLALELAARKWPADHVGASTILHRLATREARNPEVLGAIGELYTTWGLHAVARGVFEQVARLEPDDEEHWFRLVRAWLASGDVENGIAAYKRVARRQPGALLRLGELLLDEGEHERAIDLLAESIALDGKNPAPYRLQAWAYDALEDYKAAIEAAEHELAVAPPDGIAHRSARHHVVQMLVKARATDGLGPDGWSAYIERWKHAFMDQAPPDVDAGYLLVDAFETAECQVGDSACAEIVDIVDKLATLAPDDPDVVQSQVRAYRNAGRTIEAIEKLRRFAARAPAHRKDAERQIAAIQRDAAAIELVSDPFPDGGGNRYFTDDDDVSRLAVGLHLAIGADMHGTMGSSLTLGLAGRYRLGHLFAIDSRVDWSQRGGVATAPNAVGASFAVLTRLVEGQDSALALGLGERTELRLGDQMNRTWDRVGAAGEASLEILLHDSPIGLGARVEQWLLGGQHDTRGVIDFSVQWR